MFKKENQTSARSSKHLRHRWRNRGSPGRPLFFQGGRAGGALIIPTILPQHECIENLTGLPLRLEPRKELKSRDISFKILFVGWREQKLEARTVGLKPTSIGHVTCGQAKYGL